MAEERRLDQAPALAPERRAQMTAALYDKFYAQTLPREDFDAQMASKPDIEIANTVYDTFYKDQLSRREFNAQVGLTSARGSTQNAVVQGFTGGFGDEVAATGALVGQAIGRGVRSLLGASNEGRETPLEAFSNTRDAYRQNAEVFRQNNPWVGNLLELGGGVASLPQRAGAALPSFPRLVGQSAAVGGVAGFGSAEGGDGGFVDNVVDRAIGAGTGAAIGAGVSLAAPAVAAGAQRGAGFVGRAVGLTNPDAVTTDLVAKALRDDGLTPVDVALRMRQYIQAGQKPEMLIDLGGENTRRLARTAAGRMGPGTDEAVTRLAERQAGQPGRVADDAATGLGQSADDFFTRRTALAQQRSTQAAPLYERAFQQPITPAQYARVAPLVNDKIGQEALARGLRVIELEELAAGRTFDPAAYGVRRVNGQLVPVEGAAPNMRLLDAVKRGFDDIVEGFRDGTTGRLNLDQYGNAVNSARAAYRDRLAQISPDYKKALEAWSGPSQSMDAMARGRNIFTMRDAEAARAAGETRNPADAEFFRLGVAQAIQERIASAPDGVDAVKRIFGSAAKRSLLRQAFPDQASFDAFQAAMNREAAMFRNGQFVSPRTGSQTNMRGNDQEDTAGLVSDLAMGAVTGNGNALGRIGQFASNRAAGARGVTPEVGGRLVQALMTDDPKQIMKVLRDLSRAQAREAAAAAAARGIAARAYPGVTSGVQAE